MPCRSEAAASLEPLASWIRSENVDRFGRDNHAIESIIPIRFTSASGIDTISTTTI